MKSDIVNNSNLQELGGSNYEIEDGQPDIRGWEVKNESGKKFGKVKELLFDESSRKVRYLVLNLKGNDFDIDAKKVLIPIGIASLHEKEDDVILNGVSASKLQMLPEYEKDAVNPDMERFTRNAFEGVGVAAGAAAIASGGDDDSFYNHHHFDESNLYRNRNTEGSASTIPVINEEIEVGKKTVQTGGMRLRSRIVETPVQRDISLKEETVSIERNPVNRPADISDLREESIEVRTTEEVPVVSKEARVVEEVSLKKEVNETEETIHDTVRNTEVDVDDTTATRRNQSSTSDLI